MDGMRDIFFVDKQRNLFSVNDLVQVLVSMTGHAHGIGKALIVEDPAHVVRLMAVDAYGYLVRLLLPQLALDDFQVHLFDLCVALHAGCGDVVAVD